jgi:hypothetical protein
MGKETFTFQWITDANFLSLQWKYINTAEAVDRAWVTVLKIFSSIVLYSRHLANIIYSLAFCWLMITAINTMDSIKKPNISEIQDPLT